MSQKQNRTWPVFYCSEMADAPEAMPELAGLFAEFKAQCRVDAIVQPVNYLQNLQQLTVHRRNRNHGSDGD